MPSQTAAASSKVIAAGHVREQARLAHADVLRVRAVPQAEDAVADGELR